MTVIKKNNMTKDVLHNEISESITQFPFSVPCSDMPSAVVKYIQM